MKISVPPRLLCFAILTSSQVNAQELRHFSLAIARSKRLAIILCLIGVLCVSSSKNAEGGELKREEAVKIAKQEVARRRLSLPKNYIANISDSLAFIEFQPTREIYIVSFTFAYHGKARVAYEVNIDKRSGKVDDLTDLRTAIPLR
jgi:hypothetical protein